MAAQGAVGRAGRAREHRGGVQEWGRPRNPFFASGAAPWRERCGAVVRRRGGGRENFTTTRYQKIMRVTLFRDFFMWIILFFQAITVKSGKNSEKVKISLKNLDFPRLKNLEKRCTNGVQLFCVRNHYMIGCTPATRVLCL